MNHETQYKSIPGHPDYSVGYDGSILSYKGKEPRALTPCVNSRGYHHVVLWTGGKRTDCVIHRLVAQAFLPNPCNRLEVNHVDADKTHNHVSNLAWVTRKENVAHAHEHDLCPVGSKHYNAKLTESQVAHIKTLLEDGVSQRNISWTFGVAKGTIYYIAAGKTWKHVN